MVSIYYFYNKNQFVIVHWMDTILSIPKMHRLGAHKIVNELKGVSVLICIPLCTCLSTLTPTVTDVTEEKTAHRVYQNLTNG